VEAGAQHAPRRRGRPGRDHLGAGAQLPARRHARELPGFEPWFHEGTVLKVSPEDGRVLDEISTPPALRTIPGLLPPSQETFDPTHLNDGEVVTAEQARAFPMLAPGDVLVSLRNVSNASAAIDPVRKTAK